MSVDMKWYIFNSDKSPLCWATDDGKAPACKFDTEEDAKTFLDALSKIPAVADMSTDAEIAHCIFFYDDGTLNVSGFIPVQNGDDIELKRMEV